MDKPFAITLGVGSSLVNKTGAWRTERPVYSDRLPPCNNACPAGENIQRWLYHAEEANYEAAWRQIMVDNPFPAIMGRACYHTCQNVCNRALLDEAVGINSVERFLGDEAIRQGWTVDITAAPTGKRVLVVGAGASGLSAAYHLRLRGHDVTIVDASSQAGGMMRYGIPAYRLPRDVLDAEVNRIVAMGVRMELGRTVTDVVSLLRHDPTGNGHAGAHPAGNGHAGAHPAGNGAAPGHPEGQEEKYDAIFLAVGAQLAHRTYLPAGDSARILDALTVLRSVAEGQPLELGRRVVVYGGGNTAMDVARSAKRLGVEEPVVVYRRTRAQMPAQQFEVEEAEEEGVQLRWLSTIAHADAEAIRVEKMRLDDKGYPQPTGEFDELAADTVVLAVGQNVDHSIVEGVHGVEVRDGVVHVGVDMMTGYAGVFAGGDMVPSERTLTAAIGHGKRAARHIDAWLHGTRYTHPPRPQLAEFERLNTWYYTDAPATVRPRLEVLRRVDNFEEVQQGLDADTALFEARRCLSCGNCFECDNCYGMCPDNAIIKLGPGNRFAIDYDYCKGCGICVAECPCGAIDMVPEHT